MRFALGIEPATADAREKGCTCQGKYHIDKECPLHFPLQYLDRANKMCDWIDSNKHWQPLTFIIALAILIIEVLTRF